MEKIADGYFRFNQTLHPTDGVTLDMRVDRIDGEELDTSVELKGSFAICGKARDVFSKELGALIDKFRI